LKESDYQQGIVKRDNVQKIRKFESKIDNLKEKAKSFRTNPE
jgi:hypothetical protein